MNREFFNRQFAVLVNAYTMSVRLSDESQVLYWDMLKRSPGVMFGEGVAQCLGMCKYLPTIAELGNASMPPIKDRKAPLPAVDRPWPTIDWREQLKREGEGKRLSEGIRRKQIDGTKANS